MFVKKTNHISEKRYYGHVTCNAGKQVNNNPNKDTVSNKRSK